MLSHQRDQGHQRCSRATSATLLPEAGAVARARACGKRRAATRRHDRRRHQPARPAAATATTKTGTARATIDQRREHALQAAGADRRAASRTARLEQRPTASSERAHARRPPAPSRSSRAAAAAPPTIASGSERQQRSPADAGSRRPRARTNRAGLARHRRTVYERIPAKARHRRPSAAGAANSSRFRTSERRTRRQRRHARAGALPRISAMLQLHYAVPARRRLALSLALASAASVSIGAEAAAAAAASRWWIVANARPRGRADAPRRRPIRATIARTDRRRARPAVADRHARRHAPLLLARRQRGSPTGPTRRPRHRRCSSCVGAWSCRSSWRA